jgi:hypothetical protein
MQTVSKLRSVFVPGMTAGIVMIASGCVAADAQTVSDAASSVGTSGAVTGFLESVATNYPWVTVVLLVIGALRVVFKPVMVLLDSYVKSNCSAEDYAKIQSFESGSIYKWLCFGLDLLGSVKLPVIGVKPTQTGSTTPNTTDAKA